MCKRPVLPPVIYLYLINGSLKTWKFHEILIQFSELGDVENADFDEYFETVNSMGFLDSVSHDTLIT